MAVSIVFVEAAEYFARNPVCHLLGICAIAARGLFKVAGDVLVFYENGDVLFAQAICIYKARGLYLR